MFDFGVKNWIKQNAASSPFPRHPFQGTLSKAPFPRHPFQDTLSKAHFPRHPFQGILSKAPFPRHTYSDSRADKLRAKVEVIDRQNLPKVIMFTFALIFKGDLFIVSIHSKMVSLNTEG